MLEHFFSMENLPTPIDPIKDVVDSLVGGVLVEVKHTYVYVCITGDRETDIAVLLYIYCTSQCK